MPQVCPSLPAGTNYQHTYRLKPNSIDLLCFPEMAFTGYVFDSAKAISPYLEEPRIGPSSLFCQEIARKLKCYVAGGYPERLGKDEPVDVAASALNGAVPTANSTSVDESGTANGSQPCTQVGANSAILYGPFGEWVGGYRKTNLFETDKTWAKPGTGFTTFSLPLRTSHDADSDSDDEDALAPVVDITLGICMDLNPQPPAEWTSPDGPFELADFCVKHQSRVLVLLNAWLYSGLNEDGEAEVEEEENGQQESSDVAGEEKAENGEQEEQVYGEKVDTKSEPDWYTLRYWTARLRPLWRRDGRRRGSNETIVSGSTNGSGVKEEAVAEEQIDEVEEEEKPPHETIVVVCNRTGKENGISTPPFIYAVRMLSLCASAGKTFAGSSAIFSMRAGSGRPKLLDMMGRREEGVRVWNLLV
ncbi:hypothetical protein H0H81_010547 [Sphagnurus paluster]|uniref:CN hydrolase domain-containing protein n=1 Tax=Sphagnurus paluster TaxID=117069 RepID=A0A9P7G0X0_9AGAR|nr:hypothetical protein H0H81_010547 [Sphagnurus paluster]